MPLVFAQTGRRQPARPLPFSTNGHTLALVLLLLVGAGGMAAATAGDWPQVGGPRRDNTSTETGLVDRWPEGGPRVVWERKGLGGGFSNPIVSAGRVFVIGRQALGKLKGWASQECGPGPDVLWCLDRTSGQVLWKVEFPFHVEAEKSTAWSTPAADGEMVYARGGDGEVRCLAIGDGKQLWSWPKNQELLAQKENQADSRYAGGLTLDGDLVLFQGVAPGGRKDTLIAADKKTGEVRWEVPIRSWLHGARNPLLIEVQGKRLLGISGQILEAQGGKKVGECPLDDWWIGHQGAQIVVGLDRELKIPAEQEAAEKARHGEGYQREAGVQCLALDWKNDATLAAQQRWEWSLRGTAEYEPKGVKDFGGPIITGGYAYTFVGIRTQGNRLLCLDMATGKQQWMSKIRAPLGTSHPLYADGKIFVLNNGHLLMIAADPQEYRELGYAQVSLQSWAAPALSDGCLFLRDDAGTVKCLDLRSVRKPEQAARLPDEKTLAADWPQWGGPRGDWSAPDQGLLDQWPEGGPKLLWKAKAEPGFACPIVAHGHVYLLGRKDWGIKKDKEGQIVKSKEGKLVYDLGGDGWTGGDGPVVLHCLDRRSGAEKWRYVFTTAKPKGRCPGPCVTPVADEERVYALDGARELVCLSATDGKVLWRQMGSDLLGGANDRARAPERLVLAGQYLVCVGQVPDALQINALDRLSGEFRWTKYLRPPKWQIRYTTPRLLHVGTRPYLLQVGADVLSCLDLHSEGLWELKVAEKEGGFYDPFSGVCSGSRSYLAREKTLEALEATAGPGAKGIACKHLWTVEARPGGVGLVRDGRLFTVAPGNDSRLVNARDVATGELLWEGKVDKAQLAGGIAADGKLVLTTGNGQLVLVQAGGPKMKVLAQATIAGLEACWSYPALSNGQLFLRDCSGAIICLDLKTP